MKARWLVTAWGALYSSSLFRFLFVGGITTVLQMALLMMAVELMGVPPVWASAASYCVSAVCNYLMNYHFSFAGSNRPHRETLPKFIVVAFNGVMINTFTFYVFLKLTGFYLVAQVFAILAAVIANYLLHKFWIYRS